MCLFEGSVKLDVTVSRGSGRFDISENDSVVASGQISILTEPEMDTDECPKPVLETWSLPLNSDDIYKELRLRGYDYGPTFRGIHSADGTGKFPLSNKMVIIALSTFDIVGWALGKASGMYVFYFASAYRHMIDDVLVWLSVWS